jgi:hypothetical protein
MEMFPRKIAETVDDLHVKDDYLKSTSKFDISEALTIALAEAVAEVDAAHAKAMDKATSTKVDTLNQELAIEKAKKLFRMAIDTHVRYSTNLTEADCIVLRIPQPGTSHPLPEPTDQPGIRNLISRTLRVEGEYFDIATGKRGKVLGARELEVYYRIGGDEPSSIAELKERTIVTRNPIVLQFAEGDAYKFVYLAFRWIGTRGGYGPWTQIYRIMIIAS